MRDLKLIGRYTGLDQGTEIRVKDKWYTVIRQTLRTIERDGESQALINVITVNSRGNKVIFDKDELERVKAVARVYV